MIKGIAIRSQKNDNFPIALMSGAGPAPGILNPNRPEPTDHLSSSVNLSPDPLLQSGSFIDVNPPAPASANGSTTSSAETLNKKERKSAKPVSSNGAGPETTPQRRPTKPAPPESLTWLPAGWSAEDRLRTSGVTAGTVDRYYFDPVSGRQFRSKKEVLYFLETGTPRKKKRGGENSDADVDSLGSSGSNKQKSVARGKTSAPNFDYINAPEKIQWVLTGPSEDFWTPFVGKDKVPEYVRRDWVAAFACRTTNNSGFPLL